MSISKRLSSAMQEAQRVTPALAFSDEEGATKPGAFKVSSRILKMWKDEAGKDKPSDLLFKKVRDFVEAIPREELPSYFGLKNIPDTQDFIANKPRNAFHKWLRLSAERKPPLHAIVLQRLLTKYGYTYLKT